MNLINCLYIEEAAQIVAAPIVAQAPAMAPPVQVAVAQPAPVMAPAPMMGGGVGILGKLKLHLKAAKLQFHDGPALERMSPYVTVTINGREERSPICERGGKHPSWDFVHFDFEVIDLNHIVEIVVRDKDMMIGGQMLGHARVPMGRFAIANGANEWIELFREGMAAGTVHFKSEYWP